MASKQKNTKQTLLVGILVAIAAIYVLVGIAHPPQGESVTNEAIYSFLFKTGQRMVSRSNMTETIIESASIAVILDLNLSSDALVGNGNDSCFVKATVFDVAGNLVPDGQPVAFIASVGKFSNGSDTVYTLTVNGEATVVLKSPILSSGVALTADVSANTLGASGLPLSKTLSVLFYSAAVRGKISSLTQHSVQGVMVSAFDANNQEVGRDTVREDGVFLIPIRQSGEFLVEFRYRNVFGDDITISVSQRVEVPAVGGNVALYTLSAIVGNVVNASTGQPLRRANLPVMMYHTAAVRQYNERKFTDDRGVFVFDSLTAGSTELHVTDIDYSGKLLVVHQEPGAFILDANIGLSDTSTFEVMKSANKRTAEIGDVVTYTVEVRNTSLESSLFDVKLVDELPQAFVLAKNGARSDGVILPEPTNRRKIEWHIADSLAPQKTIRVTYTVSIGAGALESDGINKAYATATTSLGQNARTALASVQVTVRPGVFSDRGIVIGKVFYDLNENAQQDSGEAGISGVELWMEDGTRVSTGDDGKYSLPEVRSGQHVVRVNEATLPYGSDLLALKSESAGDGLTRFIQLVDGGIARTDFYVRPPHQAKLTLKYQNRQARVVGDTLTALYIIEWFDIGSPKKLCLTDTVSEGYAFDLKSTTWRGKPLNPEGKHARSILIDFPKRGPNCSDTLRIAVVADSNGVQKKPSFNAKLTTTYARGRDAIFHAVEEVTAPEAFPEASLQVAAHISVDKSKQPTPRGALQANHISAVELKTDSVKVPSLAGEISKKERSRRRTRIEKTPERQVTTVAVVELKTDLVKVPSLAGETSKKQRSRHRRRIEKTPERQVTTVAAAELKTDLVKVPSLAGEVSKNERSRHRTRIEKTPERQVTTGADMTLKDRGVENNHDSKIEPEAAALETHSDDGVALAAGGGALILFIIVLIGWKRPTRADG